MPNSWIEVKRRELFPRNPPDLARREEVVMLDDLRFPLLISSRENAEDNVELSIYP